MLPGSGDSSHSMLRNLIASLTRRKFAKTQACRLAVAQAAFAAGEYELAEPEFLSLAQADPHNGEVWLHAGVCAAQRGDLHLALMRLDNACACSPANHQTLYRRSETLMALGRHTEAIAGCHAIIAMAPKFNPGFNLLASLLLPGESYLATLPRLHAFLRPATYLEIGVFRGTSFRHVLPDTRAIGVDPAPQNTEPVPPNARVFVMTSDEFFATHDVRAEFGGQVVMLGFIDGMHQFEYALRDFINLERVAGPDSSILIHDCYPVHPTSAERVRCTGFWSGDIWRLILILKKYRPDLRTHTLALWPSGLGLVRGLNPASTVLADAYDAIVAEFMAVDYQVLDADKAGMLNLFPNDWDRIKTLFA